MTIETTPAPTAATLLSSQFGFAGGTFELNTKGVTHEESLTAPPGGGNCMHWIVGHLLLSRIFILDLLGQPPFRPREELQRFARGSAPLTDAADALDWDGLLADHAEAQKRIRDGLARITPERLAEPLPEDANPFRVAHVAEMLGAFLFHETYHVGQLGLARRALGKEGAIR